MGGRRRLARQFALVVAVLSSATVVLAACGGSSGTSSSGASSGAGKHVNIAHFVAIQANPVEQVVIKAGQDVGAAENATVTVFDSNNDVQRELANCGTCSTSSNRWRPQASSPSR
jgi:ABC-type oligopeptide transport system substrate-binding subunit